MSMKGVVLSDPITGKVEVLCHDCADGRGKECDVMQPNRRKYKTPAGYVRALEKAVTCDSCKGDLPGLHLVRDGQVDVVPPDAG